MLMIDQSFDGRSVQLPVGEVLELRLPENPTTGFTWTLAPPGPACAVVADHFVASGARPGQGGDHAWQIRGIHGGTCKVSLAYRRPWETTAGSARSFQLQIDVIP